MVHGSRGFDAGVSLADHLIDGLVEHAARVELIAHAARPPKRNHLGGFIFEPRDKA